MSISSVLPMRVQTILERVNSDISKITERVVSGVLLKMEVGIRKGAWRRAWRYPTYLWSLRWVYAVKKPRRLVYAVYPRIPPPSTPLRVNCQIPSHGSPHFQQFTQFSPVSLLQTSLHRNSSFVHPWWYLISAMDHRKCHASAYSTSLLLSTLLTMTSWPPVSHPGLVSMALFSAGSNHICHLAAFV